MRNRADSTEHEGWGIEGRLFFLEGNRARKNYEDISMQTLHSKVEYLDLMPNMPIEIWPTEQQDQREPAFSMTHLELKGRANTTSRRARDD